MDILRGRRIEAWSTVRAGLVVVSYVFLLLGFMLGSA